MDIAIGLINPFRIAKNLVVVVLSHLIYVSTAVLPMSEHDLVSLLRQSRAQNEQHRITGMLLYKGGHFMQVLEGEEESVVKVFNKIKEDYRHKSVDRLRFESIEHRHFPTWTMDFINADNLDPTTVPGFTRFMERDLRSDYFYEDSIEAYAMLLAFKGVPLAGRID